MKNFNMCDNSIICEIDGTRWLLGPEADGELNWEDAKEWCHSVGGELPPREVLLMCYMNEDIRKEFTATHYWSSTKFAAASTWIQDFFLHGYQIGGVNVHANSVRAVMRLTI
jgi:hypothetical protein